VRAISRFVLFLIGVLILQLNQFVVAQEQYYFDPYISYEVRKTLYEDVELGRYPWEVKVTDGVVSLSGTVTSVEESNKAESIVKNMPGVKGVKNNVQVNSAYPPVAVEKDSVINAGVVSALSQNNRVSSYKITPFTIGGRVILRGAIDSIAAELVALETARTVRGVKSVKSDLIMESGVSDSFMAFTLKMWLLADPHICGFRIKPEVQNGMITLRGKVPDEERKQIAINKARTVAGASGVISYLEIDPTIERKFVEQKDEEILNKINAILAKKEYALFKIEVTVNKGEVSLKGKIDNIDNKDTVLHLMEEINALEGVKVIKSNLEVQEQSR